MTTATIEGEIPLPSIEEDVSILRAVKHCVDMKTPLLAYLTGFYKRSFAHYTIKERLPITLTQTIDLLVRNKEAISEEFGVNASTDLKEVIGKLSQLKYEVQTNKSLSPIDTDDKSGRFYNDLLSKEISKNGGCTFFTAVWLHAECYLYRRIRDFFQQSITLKLYDPFLLKKIEATVMASKLYKILGSKLVSTLNAETYDKRIEFINLLKVNLWGNKCDLSLSNGVVSNMDSVSAICNFDSHILCDQSQMAWKLASEANNKKIIDVVMDNSGYELFTDLCLADFLVTTKQANHVRFHIKDMPWFVSDVTQYDFHWFLEYLKKSDDNACMVLARRWNDYLDKNTWSLHSNYFWTLPVSFCEMKDIEPALYEQLAEAKLVIFKGDLNYRKLFGERNWECSTPVEKALEGFHPAPICSLRTVKADIICGVNDRDKIDKLDQSEPDWMTTGDYGLIQCCDRIVV